LRRSTLSALATVLLSALSACDRVGDIVIVPEFDHTFAFEAGLDGFYANGIDLGDPSVAWSLSRSTTVVHSGTGAAALALDNTNATAKVWIERVFEVQPGRAYDIELSFDFGSADWAGAEAWRILAGAHTAPPQTVAELTVQDASGNGSASDAGVVFVAKRYTMRATADEEGRLFLAIGLWGTTMGSRTYFVDDVHVLFTRVSLGS